MVFEYSKGVFYYFNLNHLDKSKALEITKNVKYHFLSSLLNKVEKPNINNGYNRSC